MMNVVKLTQRAHDVAIIALLAAILCLLPLLPAYADSVRRWQDSQGQWHFGDSATTHGHQSQTVAIINPISIVSNARAKPAGEYDDQPDPAKAVQTGRHSRAKKYSSSKKMTQASTPNCEQLREQLHQQPVTTRKKSAHPSRQQQTSLYEHACIANHYYGNS